MQIKTIVSNRCIDPHHANDLVYEWEDDLSETLGVPLSFNHPWKNKRYSKFIPILLNLLQTDEPAFAYEMCTYRHNGNNKSNIVPCIIDFYIKSPVLVRLWYASYWRNKVVLVSSREVYEFLSGQFGFTKIRHLPLSISDRYRITPDTRYQKSYDMFIAGRQNPVLRSFWERYLTSHPDTTYVYRTTMDGKSVYKNQDGQVVSDTDSREVYMQLMQQARASMYSPPGIDGSRQTNGFSQVTPRFLEIVAACCHPLLRYPDNADTRYFRLHDFCPSIDNYEQFERLMDVARDGEVNVGKHSDYLSRHYTSVIARQLQQILSTL